MAERDVNRSEWEGLPSLDLTEREKQILTKIREDFLDNHALFHLEDAAAGVIEGLNDSEKNKYQGIKDNLSTYFEFLLGPEGWDELRTSERDRIMEYDRHESEGVG